MENQTILKPLYFQRPMQQNRGPICMPLAGSELAISVFEPLRLNNCW